MYGTLKNRDVLKKEKEKTSCGPCKVLCNSLWRVKQEKDADLETTQLARVLNGFDLIILGIGSTLGVGVYVLAGEVSKNVAGPAVTISFLLAAITSVFAGLCYAEFGARVPKAGSAYAYSYYTVGEGIAFVIGWTLLLEYGIGAASVAKGISEYINRISEDAISTAFLSFASMDFEYLAEYVDFFAAGLCLLLAGVLAIGVKLSTLANNIFTLVNLAVVLFVIISGFWKVDIKNWQIDPKDIPPGVDGGDGGFAPFGFIGIMKGAATCFYGFVGFDAIASTGEEVKNPQRSIPLAFVISLTVIFAVYFGISSVLTLMWPYWDQSAKAPFPHVYDKLGWVVPKWIVTIGACFGLFSSLFGAMFPLPRVIYSMANDGLIFRFLGTVNSKTHTPVYGTVISGVVTALMAGIFNLKQLVDMMSLGTLMAYSIVALCVMILRYSPDNPEEANTETTVLVETNNKFKFSDAARCYFNSRSKLATTLTKRIVVFNLLIFIILSIGFALAMTYLYENIFEGGWYGILIISIMVVLIILVLSSVATQPQSQRKLPFQIPLLPLIPSLSIFCNIYLMIVLDAMTWVRFAVWMAVGVIPYFFWFCWKFYKGDLNENSPYEINRLNTIRLNEEILKMRMHKHTILKGIHNPAFVEDNISDRFDKISNMEISQAEIKVDEGPINFAVVQEMDQLSLQEVDESTRYSVEVVNFNRRGTIDDNNNDLEIRKPELLVAEVHREDEKWEEIDKMDEIVNESYGFLNEEKVEDKEENKEIPRRNSRLSDVYLENINKKEGKDDAVVEKPKRNTKLEEKFLESIGEIPKTPDDAEKRPSVPPKPLIKNSSRLSEIYLENISQKEAKEEPTTESKPTRNSKLEEKFLESIGEAPKPPPLPPIENENSSLSRNPPNLPPKPSISDLVKQIRAPRKPLRHVEPKKKEDTPKLSFKDRLSRILNEQLSEISYRNSHPKESIQNEENIFPEDEENSMNYEKYKTIKTLSKAALKDKLEFVLTKGPPKRASFRESFRESFKDDTKRKNAVNALRQIENQAMETVENEKTENTGEHFETEEEFYLRKQKMLMGNVLKTIKLKDQLNGQIFLNDR